MPDPSRKAIADLISREAETPGSLERLYDDLAEVRPQDAPFFEFLKLKEDQFRQRFYVQAERLWFRKFGWRIMRPLLWVGMLAAIGFLLQEAVDPTLGISLFLAGAAACYVMIQIFANHWAMKNEKAVGTVTERYRQRLRELAEQLRRD